MLSIINILQVLDSILGSYLSLLIVFLIFFTFKLYILTNLINKLLNNKVANKPAFFLILILVGSLIDNSAWILKSVKEVFDLNISYQFYIFWIRIAWGFAEIHAIGLALFLESLVEKNNSFNIRRLCFITISVLFFLFFFGLAFILFNHTLTPEDRPDLELYMNKISTLYYLFPLMFTSLFIVIRKIRSNQLPRILTKQLKILILAVIFPYWLLDFLQIYPFDFSSTWITNSYTFVSLSNILLTCAVFYCARKIIGLRFLNFKNHVEAPTKFDFVDNFKNILEQFSHVTTMQELHHITQGFFKELFNVPFNHITLYIRKTRVQQDTEHQLTTNKITSIVETFINTHFDSINPHLKQSKILIYDEIAFNHFYEETPTSKSMLHFLETINADIFVPVYEKDTLIAYIIIDRHTRLNQFYSDMERDEMVVYAGYLGNIINLLQHRSLEALIQQEKNLQEELYRKHQEINQYKESIRSFLRTSKQKEIGIIFYKSRQFIFGNQAAKELIKININTQEGHPLTRALKQIAQHVDEYKAPHTTFAKDTNGNTIVLAAVQHLEKNNVIISVYYPEISDILKQQIDLLKDPTEWDYLLYLETTQSGQLINQLIPGSGEILLNFKINLLKCALSKKALLLDLPEEDLLPTVEILHHISLRKTLHILTIQSMSTNFDIAIKLFGINPIFGISPSDLPLLEQLNETGTLFIKNIHLLDLETQKYLAEFIRYGFYRVFKSEQKEPSSVRIICSTNKNLQTLVHEGKFEQALFNELSKTTISMPSLMTLPEEELTTLADGFTEQALKKTQTFKSLLTLTTKDKTKLSNARPTSIQELKTMVQTVIEQKSKEHYIYQETQFDVAQTADPELAEIARLGKHALKDPKIMITLWNKFKNQNKIATFLGVNRSSVNRRCKEYNLE